MCEGTDVSKILIGADPELFVKNLNSGHFVSAHDLLPGTKYEPFKVPYGAVQVDGTAAEFNIDPASTADEFVRNINAVRGTLGSMLPGYNLSPEPVALFDTSYFKSIPNEAKRLGCDPDYNGWTYQVNPHPNPGKRPFRTGAGHIHIGWTENRDVYETDHFEMCAAMARQMDYYLGIWSLLWDKDPTRRQLYGKAGAFRPKPYGMEYRVMSNAWLSSPILIRWVYNSAVRGVEAFMSDAKMENFFTDAAKEIIDNNETDWLTKYDFDIDVPPLPKEYLKAG
jgi:hypothetical protein